MAGHHKSQIGWTRHLGDLAEKNSQRTENQNGWNVHSSLFRALGVVQCLAKRSNLELSWRAIVFLGAVSDGVNDLIERCNASELSGLDGFGSGPQESVAGSSAHWLDT